MTILTDEQVVEVCEKAGFTGDSLVTAVSIALAESGGNSEARHFNPPNDITLNGSVDRGLFQINNFYHPEVSDQCADMPQCAADKAFIISESGSNFGPWSTFSNGAYRQFTNRAVTAINRDKVSDKALPAPESDNGSHEPITVHRHYHVRSGDTLWNIAEFFYRDGNEWHRIFNANKHIIGNDPDNLIPGEVLHIPK